MSDPSEDIVSVRKIFKRYKDMPVLLDLNFEIKKGTIFGYIGPNGSGKTTTIKIMTGLIRDFQGDVVIEGRSIRERNGEMMSKIGYLPQQTNLQSWRTVEQTLDTFGRLSGMPKEGMPERIGHVLEQLQIGEHRNRKVGKLSGGTIQKVGMAQAMLHQPKLLILDEPVAALDPESRVLFKNLFRQLSREGTTIFFSSHILSDIQDVADTIGILNQGRLGYIGSMESLRNRVVRRREIGLELSKCGNAWQDLDRIEGVSYIERLTENTFTIYLEENADLDSIIDRSIKHLIQNDCRIRGIHPVNPTLEDLYISYSGGEVRA